MAKERDTGHNARYSTKEIGKAQAASSSAPPQKPQEHCSKLMHDAMPKPPTAPVSKKCKREFIIGKKFSSESELPSTPFNGHGLPFMKLTDTSVEPFVSLKEQCARINEQGDEGVSDEEDEEVNGDQEDGARGTQSEYTIDDVMHAIHRLDVKMEQGFKFLYHKSGWPYPPPDAFPPSDP